VCIMKRGVYRTCVYCTCVCVCIYIYIYCHARDIYIYIYIYCHARDGDLLNFLGDLKKRTAGKNVPSLLANFGYFPGCFGRCAMWPCSV
jgi:hypothetical protein